MSYLFIYLLIYLFSYLFRVRAFVYANSNAKITKYNNLIKMQLILFKYNNPRKSITPKDVGISRSFRNSTGGVNWPLYYY